MERPLPPNALDIAFTLHQQGRLAEAERVYRRMIAEGREPLSAANNLVVLLSEAGRWADLGELYGEVARYLPSRPEWAYGVYRRLLMEERYEAGWAWYESRRLGGAQQVQAPPFPFPEWRGEPVSRLLVWGEQGFGDQIQFARYLPLLQARGIETTFVCRPPLVRLFSRLPGHVAPMGPGLQLPAHDRWILAGSLPLRLAAWEIPPPAPMRGEGPRRGRVGVMTRGAPEHVNDANRSLSDDLAHRLLALPGAISLAPEASGARDFQDTADLIAGLDLVITVDTAVAHLAGSLGKPTWILVPAERADWRWLKSRSDSPWYPSVRLFRQVAAGDWETTIGEVEAAFAAL